MSHLSFSAIMNLASFMLESLIGPLNFLPKPEQILKRAPI